MMELVNHILYIAKNNNKKITHLQIHKIAYFILGYMIRENHEDIAKGLYNNEKFQAWMYGPVLPNVYDKYKTFNNMPILDNGEKSDRIDQLPNVNDVILNLINHDVFDLVNVSHNHIFWKNNRSKIANNLKPVYTYEVLRREFSK